MVVDVTEYSVREGGYADFILFMKFRQPKAMIAML